MSERRLLALSFPGGLAVTAHVRGHEILTDQPEHAGGQDRGPAPFDLFLSSIATCTGFYAVRFCRERDIPTDGLAVEMHGTKDPESKLYVDLRLSVTLPDRFPEKYRKAIRRAMEQCSVKRHLEEAPRIEVQVVSPSG